MNLYRVEHIVHLVDLSIEVSESFGLMVSPCSQNQTEKCILCDLFRNMTRVAVNFTVRFFGVGYQAIEPLERNLVTEGMLGNRPIKFVVIEANDGQ